MSDCYWEAVSIINSTGGTQAAVWAGFTYAACVLLCQHADVMRTEKVFMSRGSRSQAAFILRSQAAVRLLLDKNAAYMQVVSSAHTPAASLAAQDSRAAAPGKNAYRQYHREESTAAPSSSSASSSRGHPAAPGDKAAWYEKTRVLRFPAFFRCYKPRASIGGPLL